jgi:YesN/AraC family two-component response regulator
MSERKLNLLIVDDSPTILRLVTTTLQVHLGEELEITALAYPQDAAAFLETHCCDILLSDVEMPGMSGMELVQAAKARNCWTQAIMMTAHSTCGHLSAAMDCGASDYLLKPIAQQELIEVMTASIKRIVRWRRALRGTLRPVN